MGCQNVRLTCFGVAVFRRVGSKIKQTNFVVLTDVIDHSALMAGKLLDMVKQEIPDVQNAKRVIVWCDCGPHFRAYEHLAYWTRKWFHALEVTVCINYFVEKHGKGLVDAMFGMVEGFINAYLRAPKRRIETFDQMVDVIIAGAEGANKKDPDGIDWQVLKVEFPAKKPEKTHNMIECEFKIQSTYCVELRPRGNWIRDPEYVDFGFSDLVGVRGTSCVGVVAEIPVPLKKQNGVVVDDGTWRRGYFGNRPWDRKKPEEGNRDIIVQRYENYASLAEPTNDEYADFADAWSCNAVKKAMRLQLRRNTWSRKARAAAAAAEADTDDDKTSSASATGQSSTGSGDCSSE